MLSAYKPARGGRIRPGTKAIFCHLSRVVVFESHSELYSFDWRGYIVWPRSEAEGLSLENAIKDGQISSADVVVLQDVPSSWR